MFVVFCIFFLMSYELHKSETRLVVKFYLDFFVFHLCSVSLNISEYVQIMLLYCC